MYREIAKFGNDLFANHQKNQGIVLATFLQLQYLLAVQEPREEVKSWLPRVTK
jgi:hypothetical protein